MNSELFGYPREATTPCITPNLSHLFVGEFCQTISLTPNISIAALLGSISAVVPLGAEEQMFRIHATRIVAMMKNA